MNAMRVEVRPVRRRRRWCVIETVQSSASEQTGVGLAGVMARISEG
jgi:hypothetical protein